MQASASSTSVGLVDQTGQHSEGPPHSPDRENCNPDLHCSRYVQVERRVHRLIRQVHPDHPVVRACTARGRRIDLASHYPGHLLPLKTFQRAPPTLETLWYAVPPHGFDEPCVVAVEMLEQHVDA